MSTGSVSSRRAPHPATTGLRPPASDRSDAPPLPGRVCLMIGQLGLGGAEKQLVLLARELSARGVTTDLLVMFEKGPREAELLGTGVTVLELGFRGRRPFLPCLAANLRAFTRLVAHLRRTRPEVLTAFLFHAYLAAAPAARLARVPVMVAGRRSLGHFQRGRRAALLAERLATRWTHAVVPDAEAVAEDVRRGEGVPERKITVIPNGLAPEAFAPARPATVETTLPVVLCVANLSRHKGHRHLLDAVARLRGGPAECTLLLTSALPGEGKTGAATALALSPAASGTSTCPVDADLRRPGVATRFGLVQDAGLITALIGQAEPADLVQRAPGGLAVLAGGPLPPNPGELLAAARMGEILGGLADRYEAVVVDTAPVLPVADTLGLAPHAHHTLLVVQAARTPRDRVTAATEALAAVGVRLLGAVLTQLPDAGRGAPDHGYGYGYGYGDPVPPRPRAGSGAEETDRTAGAGGPR